ncbi:hypothetical protein FN846DRAFT_973008 [Sphaerosporella brunnea]|uniref:Uncharacterized protein n=1 Tax=Sphaerosporella brunnea TaxID=1250544 RepID=A0A5J5EG25_9PEZI|nr:hypothetical protein FN846DRAFT_973008 [Sphaerosporella brunnea]
MCVTAPELPLYPSTPPQETSIARYQIPISHVSQPQINASIPSQFARFFHVFNTLEEILRQLDEHLSRFAFWQALHRILNFLDIVVVRGRVSACSEFVGVNNQAHQASGLTLPLLCLIVIQRIDHHFLCRIDAESIFHILPSLISTLLGESISSHAK